MKLLFFPLLLLGRTALASAQVFEPEPSKTILRGNIRDANGSPLPFAGIVLLNSKDSSFVKGALSNETGVYELTDVKAGRYIVAATMIGYKIIHSAAFEVTSATTEAPFLAMIEAAKTLTEVTVVAQQPVFEQQLDKLVINVQSIVTAAGSSALDVLERSSGITVNRRNNALSLAGKSGVVVMINGKTSRLPMDAVLQMLTGTNAANVEKIELITNPSARYDAEGDAGIIKSF